MTDVHGFAGWKVPGSGVGPKHSQMATKACQRLGRISGRKGCCKILNRTFRARHSKSLQDCLVCGL
jgi:hypothetical protein